MYGPYTQLTQYFPGTLWNNNKSKTSSSQVVGDKFNLLRIAGQQDSFTNTIYVKLYKCQFLQHRACTTSIQLSSPRAVAMNHSYVIDPL